MVVHAVHEQDGQVEPAEGVVGEQHGVAVALPEAPQQVGVPPFGDVPDAVALGARKGFRLACGLELLQALFLELLPTDSAVRVLRRFMETERERLDQWRAHRAELAAGQTPVIAARLSKQPAGRHDRTKRLKAAAFDGLVALGNARIEWADRMIEVLLETAPEAVPTPWAE